jgi:phospholipase C
MPFRTVLSLELENAGRTAVNLRLRALGYGDRSVRVRLAAGQTRTTAWETDQGWYDVEITAQEDPAFRRRITGRVETGRPAVSA